MLDTHCRKALYSGLVLFACAVVGCSDSDRVLDNGTALSPEGLFVYEAADESGEVIVTGTVQLTIVGNPVTPVGEGEFRVSGAWDLAAAEGVDPDRPAIALQTGEGFGVGGQTDQEFWFNLHPVENASDIQLVGESTNGRIVGRWNLTLLPGETSGPFVLYPIPPAEPVEPVLSVLDHPL